VRRMWSLILHRNREGYEQPIIKSFALYRPDILTAFGSFSSRYHARESLRKIARESSLCLKILGLESTRGPARCLCEILLDAQPDATRLQQRA
jgi:hypothetical protein